MMTAVPIMKAAPGWSPSPFQAPAAAPPPLTRVQAPAPRPTLAQAVTATPTTPPSYAPQPSFIDSALVSAIFTTVGVVAYSTLGYGAHKAKWVKSEVIFFGMAGLLGVSTLLNLYEVRQR